MDTHKEDTKQDPSERKKIILRPRRVDYPRRDRTNNEEYAAEINPAVVRSTAGREIDVNNGGGETQAGSGKMGIIGLGFGIASLFVWSIILGPVAAVIGYYAYARDQKTSGAWAMGLGIVSTLSYLVMLPFAR